MAEPGAVQLPMPEVPPVAGNARLLALMAPASCAGVSDEFTDFINAAVALTSGVAKLVPTA